MELNDLTDDELLTELRHAVEAVEEAKRYVDEVLVEGAGRSSIKNPVLGEILGLRERQLYNRLRDARWNHDRLTKSADGQ